mmetsp:Transcript_52733/g.146412  ORF Transcript_52733/g.146412 Transcript_52733/m.146412 type:complete len:152 (+) Transcript_52733:364-819(+)
MRRRRAGECPIRLGDGKFLPHFLEPVVDSSRYFVLRVQAQNSNKHAYVGIGFREREAAFSLKATLQVRGKSRRRSAPQATFPANPTSPHPIRRLAIRTSRATSTGNGAPKRCRSRRRRRRTAAVEARTVAGRGRATLRRTMWRSPSSRWRT